MLKEATINFQSTWWDTLFKHPHSWLHAITIVRTSFRTNLRAIVSLNVKEFLTQSKRHIWDLSDSNRVRNHNYSVHKQTLCAVLWVLICMVHLTVCYYYVMHKFQSESTLYSLPECQWTQNRCHICFFCFCAIYFFYFSFLPVSIHKSQDSRGRGWLIVTPLCHSH